METLRILDTYHNTPL